MICTVEGGRKRGLHKMLLDMMSKSEGNRRGLFLRLFRIRRKFGNVIEGKAIA